MKISLDDLKSAIEWISKNTDAVTVNIKDTTTYANFITLEVRERNGQDASISIYSIGPDEQGLRTPKITRTKTLGEK